MSTLLPYQCTSSCSNVCSLHQSAACRVRRSLTRDQGYAALQHAEGGRCFSVGALLYLYLNIQVFEKLCARSNFSNFTFHVRKFADEESLEDSAQLGVKASCSI